MNNDTFPAGSIVKLPYPLKPYRFFVNTTLDSLFQRTSYRKWAGFTHGIVAHASLIQGCCVNHPQDVIDGQCERRIAPEGTLALIPFDPERGFIYTSPYHPLPWLVGYDAESLSLAE